jgi:lipopolysaccharide export LptBFGC system permease protein LptF
MVLLGCSLSIKRDRIKKNVLKILYGLIVGLLFHFSSDLIKTFGQSSDLNIFLSVWAAPLIFNFLLLSSLIHLEDG